MNKAIMTMLAMMFFTTTHSSIAADQFEYQPLNDYQAQAEKLVQVTKVAQSRTDLQTIIDGTHDLIKIGIQIINQYGKKNPNCSKQFETFLQDLNTMDSLPVEEVKKKYHDGVGLPTAPRHCYFGRSQIVHPIMSIILLKGEWSESTRQNVLDNFEEAIEHLSKIQKNLNNPPN
jgi:hypothetical protein